MPDEIYAIELAESRGWQYDGGRVSATRTFKVWENTATLGNPSELTSPAKVRAYFNVSTGTSVGAYTFQGPDKIPERGQAFPDDSSVYAQSYTITRETNTDIWVVVWTYRNAQVTSAGAQPGEPGFVEYTLDIGASFAETWIVSPTYPTNGQIGTTLSAQKITGGTQIDLEGVPLSRLKYTTEIQINETIQNVSGVPSIVANMRAARGTRNNASWEGIATGKALYTGGQIRRVGVSKYQVSHRIIEDSEFHLVQVPERDATGKVPTAEINGANRARNVYWRQPFPTLSSFASISTNW